MSTKAIQAKVIIEKPEQLQILWQVHSTFNQYLPFVIKQMYRMKRGEAGKEYQEIFNSISSSQNAVGKMEAVTDLNWETSKADSENERDQWAKVASKLVKDKKILFDRKKELPNISSEFRRKIFEMAFQLISGHDELMKNWKSEHKKWIEDKKKWEEKNQQYLKVRSVFDQFEKAVGGKVTGRRQRWHKYIEFLKSHPELAAWRGKEAKVLEISDKAMKKIAKAPLRKKNSIYAKEFFKINPELEALDRIHNYYEREFVRRTAKRRNSDGFKHPPTFTQPSAITHPAWFQFKKGPGYQALNIKDSSVELNTFKGWLKFTFKADPRLYQFEPVKIVKTTRGGKEKEADSYEWTDSNLQCKRPVDIKGIKLVFRNIEFENKTGNLISADPYLIFTCDIPDLSSKHKLRQDSCDKYSFDWVRKRIMNDTDGKIPVTCAIDLGIRHLGAATVRKDGKIIRTRIIWEDSVYDTNDSTNIYQRGPGLGHIALHKRQISKIRSLRGKPIKGEESSIELQQHIDNMGEDRFKKGARKIIQFALGLDGSKNNDIKADLILIEKLGGKTFVPMAEREHGINKALINWNRGNLVTWIKRLAVDAGLRVVEVPPAYTSQVCSKCGEFGKRYSYEKNKEKQIIVKDDPCGKLFRCSKLGCYADVNADYNASVNLHKKFFGEMSDYQNLKDKFEEFKKKVVDFFAGNK
ncbi:MAG: transposase [Planctomycetes bacterium]|nr:transposase [Planctomycetota bacterium]